ncbi:hypothetical protein LUZ60_013220 [Juncus effusus]|nr:hypothetical protein LUZ60_013220 [Juncus effusus]
MIGVYFLVSSFFVQPDSDSSAGYKPVAASPPAPAEKPVSPPPALFAEPVQMGEMTMEELRKYNGSDRNQPLLISIKGDVYNVSRGWLFYGPGGQYSFFAGREISRALALMSFDPNDFNDKLEDLGADELEVLSDWEEKFRERYVKVGRIITNKNNVETNETIEKNNVETNETIETAERIQDD